MTIRRNIKFDAAFTLIELMIAIMIFGLVLVAINGVFYGAMRLRSKTTQMVEESLPLQQAVAVIKRDLQGLVAYNGTLTGSLVAGGTTVQSVQRQGGGTDFYTCSATLNDNEPWGDIQKVTYTLRKTDNLSAGRDLIRVVTRNLLPVTQEDPEDQFLMGGVEQMDLYYYDGLEWKNTWDTTTDTNGLPQGVKMVLSLVGNDPQQRTRIPVNIVVPILVQSLTNQALTIISTNQ